MGSPAEPTSPAFITDTSNTEMEAFKGKFERTSAEQYEEFLEALDLSYFLRKAASISTPVLEITEEGGIWTVKTSTTLHSAELKFKLNEEFDETTPDGREVTGLVKIVDGKMVQQAKAKDVNRKSTKIIREMNGPDEMIVTTIIEGMDVSCVQKFRR